MLSQGVKHMLWAGIFFSFMNLGVKLLPDMPVMQIVFFRALFVLVITFIYLKKNHIAILGNNKKILLLRGLFGFLALSLYFYTIQHMPFASAVIIMQLSPIFTTLFAIVLLKEKIKPLQLVFFFLSFVGVLFIKGFDTRISVVMLAIALLAAAISALAYNMIRLLKDTDHAMVVVFYFPLVAIPFSGTYTAFHFQMPTAYQWFILLLVSISTQIA